MAQGATVDLSHFSPAYTGTFTGSGAGTVALQGGTLNPGQGGVTFNFPAGMFQWTNGNINTALGDVTNKGVMTIAGPNTHLFFDDGTLDDFGTIIQTGSGSLELHSDNVFPTTLKIEPGASYLIEADSGITAAAATAIDNDGIIKKTTGSGTSIIQADGTLTNTGTIEADSGTISLSATIAQVSGSTLTAGTWNALGGSTIQFPAGTNLTTNQAGVTLSGSGASIPALANLATNAGTFSRARRGHVHHSRESLEYRYPDHRPGQHADRQRQLLTGLGGARSTSNSAAAPPAASSANWPSRARPRSGER